MTGSRKPKRREKEKLLLVDLIAQEIKGIKEPLHSALDWNRICEKFNASDIVREDASKTELLHLWRGLRRSAAQMRQRCGDQIHKNPVLGPVDVVLQKYSKRPSPSGSKAKRKARPEKRAIVIPSQLLRRSKRKLYTGSTENKVGTQSEILQAEDFTNGPPDSRSDYLKKLAVKPPKTNRKGSANFLSKKDLTTAWDAVMKTASRTEISTSTVTEAGLAESHTGVLSSTDIQSCDKVKEKSAGNIVAFPVGLWKNYTPTTAATVTTSSEMTPVPGTSAVTDTYNHADRGTVWKVIMGSDPPNQPAGVTGEMTSPEPGQVTAEDMPDITSDSNGKVSVNNGIITTESETVAKRPKIVVNKPVVVENKKILTATSLKLVPHRYKLLPKMPGVAVNNRGIGADHFIAFPQLESPRLESPKMEPPSPFPQFSSNAVSLVNMEKNAQQTIQRYHTSTPKNMLIPASLASFCHNISGQHQQVQQVLLQTDARSSAQHSLSEAEKSGPKHATADQRSQTRDPNKELRDAQANDLFNLEVRYRQQQIKQSQLLHEAKVTIEKEIADETRKLHEAQMRKEEEVAQETHKLLQIKMTNALRLAEESQKIFEAQAELEAQIAEQKRQIQNANLRAVEASAHLDQELHSVEMETARLKRDEAETKNKIAELKLKQIQMELDHIAAVSVMHTP